MYSSHLTILNFQEQFLTHLGVTPSVIQMKQVPQEEKDGLVMFVDANKGGSIPFGQLIPSTSTQLTEAEAISLGWLPEDPI